jgi:protein O-mannosyl-transferase
MNSKSSPSLLVLLLFLILLVTGIIYFPALESIFLLDDFLNLRDLGEIKDRGLGFYLFGNSAGPGGRPLSLLTFAMQHESWPADPFAFKLTNLLLHLLNGVLVFYICCFIVPHIKLISSARIVFPYLVTGLWLIHPIQLTTVLYVVQRMTILSTTFMLSGLVIYLVGRKYYLSERRKSHLFLTIAGIYLCMVLSILSKEIGIVLPLYILTLEFSLLNINRPKSAWRQYTVPFLVLPLIMFVIYILVGFEGLVSSHAFRGYSLGQRLLSEANVLVDYLRLLLTPAYGAFTLFRDDYPISNGFLTPPITLINSIIILMLLLIAMVYRRKLVIISFAILWFFFGHILESTLIPLEIFFEHRNYLPSLGIIIFVSWILIKVTEQIQQKIIRFSIIPGFVLLITMVTIAEVGLWKNPYLQANSWAAMSPLSKRAHNHLLNLNLIMNNETEINRSISNLESIDSADIYSTIKKITIYSCYQIGNEHVLNWDSYYDKAINAKYRGASILSELDTLGYLVPHHECDALMIDKLVKFIDTLTLNPEFSPLKGELHGHASSFAALDGDLINAIFHINKAIEVSPAMDRKVFKLRLLLANKQISESTELLRNIKISLKSMPRDFLYFHNTIDEIDGELQALQIIAD